MDARRELLHNIHALCSFQCCQHLGLGGLRSAQTDVIQNAALEQAAVLEHKGDGIHPFFLGDVPHIRSAHPDAAALHIKEPADKVCQRGFSAAGGAYKSHGLSRLNVQRNALDDLGFSVVAEMHIPQRNRGILRVLRNSLHLHGRRLQHRVDACQRIRYHHLVLTHVHYTGQSQGDHRRDDDIEQQVQQKLRGDAVSREQQPACDQKGEHTVDGGGVEHHGQAQVFGVGDDPLFILINGGLELFEGKYRLPEGLDHRDAPDVLHGLVGHRLQGVAVLPHFFSHPLAGHGRHDEESQHHRRKAQQTQPPVERQQQNQQPHRGSDGVVLVWQLVGQIGLGCSGALMDDLAQLTAAESLGKAQRQHRQMLRHRQPQIGRHPERRQVGAHQRCNVNKVRQHCKQHCHPAVMRDVHRLRVVRRGVQHIPQDLPDVHKRHQRH